MGTQGQPGQPSFRYPTTANYLAQLTGHDLHKQATQLRSGLPVAQLDTSLQHRHLAGRLQAPPSTSSQADVLAYPASSLAHFQQLLQAQAANGFAPQHLDAQSQAGMNQTAALQAAQHAAQQHQWLPPKAAATLAPPSDKSNPDQGGRDLSRSASLSPNGSSYAYQAHVPDVCSHYLHAYISLCAVYILLLAILNASDCSCSSSHYCVRCAACCSCKYATVLRVCLSASAVFTTS